MKMANFTRVARAMAFAITAANAAHAATIDFGTTAGNFSPYVEDGYSFNPGRLVNGNCLDGSCLALNKNETTVMTFAGGIFTLQELSFDLLGKPSILTVFDTNHTSSRLSFSVPSSVNSTNYYTVSFGNLFSNVTSITFVASGNGNVRVDDVTAVSQVPLPAAGWLLGTGLAGLVGVSYKRKTA